MCALSVVNETFDLAVTAWLWLAQRLQDTDFLNVEKKRKDDSSSSETARVNQADRRRHVTQASIL